MEEPPVDRVRVFGEGPQAVERIAPGYFESHFVAEHLARYKWASRWVKDRIVLDVACGTGYGVSVLRAAGARKVVSVDISRDALRFGTPRLMLQAVCGDAHHLPIGSGTFDCVVSLETIEHLSDPAAYAKELGRILRPGGDLLMSTPNVDRSSGQNPYHLHEMTFEEIRTLLYKSGFHLTGAWGQHCALPHGVWQRIKGVRRVLWEIERMPTVTRLPRAGFRPIYWCVRAVRM